MECIESIKTRASVKLYKDKEVSDELISEILAAGMAAPSARNLKPYRIVVIKNRELLNALAALSPSKKMLEKAPICIVIIGNLDIMPDTNYIIQDCSAVTENILIATHSLGLGGCWLGITPNTPGFYNEVAKLLNCSDKDYIVSLVVIGYPGSEFKPKDDRYTKTSVTYIK